MTVQQVGNSINPQGVDNPGMDKPGMDNTYVHFITDSGARLIAVSEVVEIVPMVMLDQSKTGESVSGFKGLFNYRGRIIPVFELSADKNIKPLDVSHFLIVTSVSGSSIAIVATEVNQLVSVLSSDISHINPLGEQSFSVAKVNDSMLRVVHTRDFLQ